MSCEPDTGMRPEPGTAVPAPGAQATQDAVNGTGTRLPGGGSRCDSADLASEPFTSVLALPSRPGAQARMLVTACADGYDEVFEGVCAGQAPGWVLGGGDVVLDITWPGGPGSDRRTDVAVRQMICGI